MQYLLKYADRKKFEPHLAVFNITGKEREVVPEDVPVYDLSTRLHPASVFLVFKLRKLIKKLQPESIVSFTWGVNLISLIAGGRAEVFINERTVPSQGLHHYSFKKVRKFLISLLYKKATKVISCAEFVKTDLINNFNIPEKNIVVIPNAVDIEKIQRMKEEFTPQVSGYILACGGLRWPKNFEFLLETVANINKTLIILGEGPLREELVRKANDLGVNLILPGFVENPYPYFKNADVFCLTSRYEGLPNVVLEAMACKCPVVAVDCPGGIKEVIENEVDGLIVPMNNTTAFTAAIKRVLNDENLRKRLMETALRKVTEKFSIKKMVSAYEELLY